MWSYHTMFLFKAKQWWSNNKLQEESEVGTQNGSCLKVDKFNSHNDSDCILICEESLLKIYKPNNDENVSDVLLEKELNDSILHIETGKFIVGSDDRQIIVLHPQSYSIYQLKRKEGHTDAGEQNELGTIIKRTFTRKAHSLICGPFGNIKTRDFVCIQGLDGSLSFFDQDTFLFMCLFDDVIIPGPISYIPSCDSFVICKSTWMLEIYSYQQLREFSEVNLRQSKKNIPQWSYNVGEEVSGIQVIQTSNNFSSIIALGERHLCCFQDNGLMKYMIKFDFTPVCFNAYLIGWYYEPTSRLLVMVASEDSKLYIYEGTTLLWCCDLLKPAISIHRCFLKLLPGGIVTLAADGTVCASYLGTEPDLNANAAPAMNEVVDPEQIQEELEVVEESLQKILENKEGADNTYTTIEQILKIKADVGKPVQNLHQEFEKANDEMLHLLMCPVVVMLTCEDPKLIQSVQITYVCCPPFACSESTVCLDSVNGTEIVEIQVFLSNTSDIPDTNVRILFTVVDTTGKIIVLKKKVLLPLSLYCVPINVTDNHLKLRVRTTYPCVEFSKILTDFTEVELSEHGGSNDIVSLQYRTTKNTVTIKSSDNQYTIEANDFADIACVLNYFIYKLNDHYKRLNVKDFKFHLNFEEEFIKQVIHKFLKSIELHAKERIKLKDLEDDLNVLQRQFTVIQKRLLVQYGSLPPGDSTPLEYLMNDTHKRITGTVHEIIKYREIVCRAGSTLATIGRLLIMILKQTTPDHFKVKLIEEMMTLQTLYEHYQEWEEAVTQALTYIINNVLKKSEKDKEKLAPVTEQGILSHINLKRFLKQIKIVLDRMFSDAKQNDDQEAQKSGEIKISRIEEFVEVL